MSQLEQLIEAISSTLEVPASEVSIDTEAGQLSAWDSLGHINVMMTVEQEFGLQLDVEEFAELTSVRKILAYIENAPQG